MTTGKFYVVTKQPARYTSARVTRPSGWDIRTYGRETKTRLYYNAKKPDERWRSDPYVEKSAHLVAVFADLPSASAFVEEAKAAALDAEIRIERAWAAANQAQRDGQHALRDLETRMRAFWQEREARG